MGPDTKIFRWFRGKTLSIKEVSYLLSGKDKNLPAGKNPYLPFPIRKDDMNESKIKLDGIIDVHSDVAIEEMRRIARVHGIFVGPSSGAHLLAAKRLKEQYKVENVVTFFCDEGEKYINDYWIKK